MVVAANFSAQPRHDYRIGLPAAGHWSVRFNSDGKAYDQEFGDMGSPAVTAEPQGYDGQPASGTIALASYSVILLSQ